MIVDSTALPEQAVQSIIESAFQSAGQRCSALRCLYVQEDIADSFKTMLFGAMDELKLGQPWEYATDVGPVIDAEAKADIDDYIAKARADGRILKEIAVPEAGHFVPPVAIRVGSIAEMPREIFGPVLHIATFKSQEIDKVIETINATGYGLTFGLHTRIDDRVQHIVRTASTRATSTSNRNQIGAIVGSQPFWGRRAFRHRAQGWRAALPAPFHPQRTPGFRRRNHRQGRCRARQKTAGRRPDHRSAPAQDHPAGTKPGSRTSLACRPRASVLCLGPGQEAASLQAETVRSLGGYAVEADGLAPDALSTLSGFSGAVFWGGEATARAYAQALAQRDGAILPLICGEIDIARVLLERHVCVDTTAAGGNAALLAEVGDS